MNPSDLQVVWMTTPATGTPHARALQDANPDITAAVHLGTEGDTTAARNTRWRNCDANIREWWRANHKTCQASRVLFLEWDVYVNTHLDAIVPEPAPRVGLVGARLALPVRDARSWPPFSEVGRLPSRLRQYAIGIVPLGVALVSRQALDVVADSANDDAYAADVFCELRFATIIRSAGFVIAGCPLWSHAGIVPFTPPMPTPPGIWHPVKQEVQS